MNKLRTLYSRAKTEFRYSIWIYLKRSYPLNSDKYRCIYIHIPKTAGSSIYNLIGYTYIGHVPYSWYKTRDLKKFTDYFKFSIVRNPWDRLVSTFFYLKKGGNNAMDYYWAKKNVFKFNSFGDFVEEWVNHDNCNSWIHFAPQHKFIFDKNRNLQVDYLARFENLDEDFELVSKKLNLNHNLPHTNATKRNPYQEYYTERTKDIVGNVYYKDIELLGYDY